MIHCRVLGVRLLYRDETGEIQEDLEKVIWNHRKCEKTQELVLIGDFRERNRRDVMKALARFGVPKFDYGDIYYRWWEEDTP